MNIKAAYEAVSDVIGMAIFFVEFTEAVHYLILRLWH